MTGATSMIGSALIRECLKMGTKVLAIVRENSHHIKRLPKSELLQICERNLDSLNPIMEISEPYDVFYHMAWEHTIRSERDNPLLQESNIKYTLDAVNLAKMLGCKKFVGAGSQAEYGNVDGIITPETAANPITAYGMAKYSAGMLSRKLCRQYGITHVWARIFSVYGRYDREDTLINYAIDKFLKGETAKFSPGTQMWDYLYEDDAGRMFYLIGEVVNESKVYCIASGESRPLKEFIAELRSMCDSEAECVFSEKVNDDWVNGLKADIEKLVQDIGYRPEISFHKGVEKLLQWKRQPGM